METKEVKAELTFMEKMKSWKRWVGVIMTVLPIILQAITGAIGWPVAIVSAVVAAAAMIFGLAQEDAARLKAAGMAIAAAIANEKPKKEEEEEEEEWEEEEEEE